MYVVNSFFVKKFKKFVNIINFIQIFCGCGLIVVYDGKIFVFKVYSVKDGVIFMFVLFVCLLFEYVLVIGNDWWGILLVVKFGEYSNKGRYRYSIIFYIVNFEYRDFFIMNCNQIIFIEGLYKVSDVDRFFRFFRRRVVDCMYS